MDNYRSLMVAVRAGKCVLESGGEIYRVEETIVRVATALGLKEADAFVMPTGITATALDDDGQPISIIRRVKEINVDLEKISMVNDLSRAIAPNNMRVSDVEKVLDKIYAMKPFRLWFTLLSVSFIASSFTIMFNGTLRQAILAFITGPLVLIVKRFCKQLQLSSFIQNAFAGFVSATLGIGLTHVKLMHDYNSYIVGLIMILVPGLLLTNGIRDIFRGDYVSGLARIAEAIVVSTATALGAGVALFFIAKV